MRIKGQLEKIQQASRQLPLKKEEDINGLLIDLADEAVLHTDFILQENKKDLNRMDENDPKYDRLKLTKERIADIASDIKNVSALPNPLGKVLVERELENGLSLQKVTVPLGVIGIIYEARPNVTFDVFALCLKSGNACVLKGGSDAEFSNKAISGIIKKVLERNGFDPEILQLLPPDREAASELLNAVGYVDILIPRGSQNLINFVRDNAKIPVIETGAGICHTYFDEFGDLEKGREIVFNAKTRRPSVCNALDCLVIDEKRISELPQLLEKLKEKEVEVYADNKAFGTLNGKYPQHLLKMADEKSFGTEFLSLKMSVKTVPDFESAINHIYKYSSKHSEAIVTENDEHANLFLRSIDAAAVYHNTSTAFTDGAQFGLGAEIGISTQKLHARGPMALEELTSYKWLIKSNGVTRP